jgi:hypothetical protein
VRHIKGQGQLCLGHVTVHTSKAADELPSQPFDEKSALNDSKMSHLLSRLFQFFF